LAEKFSEGSQRKKDRKNSKKAEKLYYVALPGGRGATQKKTEK